jgi:hypothetical protein
MVSYLSPEQWMARDHLLRALLRVLADGTLLEALGGS